MDVPDLRHVDFDACRQRAQDLRNETVDRLIDGALAWLRSSLQPRPAAVERREPSRHCTA